VLTRPNPAGLRARITTSAYARRMANWHIWRTGDYGELTGKSIVANWHMANWRMSKHRIPITQSNGRLEVKKVMNKAQITISE